ncbi:unnamed protein product [Colias eurytheme]|nr:unnamed protein product [Colias eurytheme]
MRPSHFSTACKKVAISLSLEACNIKTSRSLPCRTGLGTGGHVAFLASFEFRGHPPTRCGADVQYAKLVFLP